MQTTHDLIIIGGGPAGYSAALYAARASLDTLVLEQGMPGGQIATSDIIDNYPGIPSCSGVELGQRMQEHAEQAGACSAYASVDSIERTDEGTFCITAGSERFRAKALIAATGATPKLGGFEGEDAFRGRGVSYCATCDGMFYRGKRVFIIGGGNSAVEEALYLSNIASSVELVVRRDALRAPRGMADRLMSRENITIRYQTSITAVSGKGPIERIEFRDNATGDGHAEEFEPGSVGVFVAVGHDPATSLVEPFVKIAPNGGVLTDEAMATETPGLFCAGDLRAKSLRQVVTAAADGATAAVSAYQYLEEHGLL